MRIEIHDELNLAEQRVAEAYARATKSGKCRNCLEYCDQVGLELHGPLSFFNIGENFDKDKYGIVFVGKNTWYDKCDIEVLQFLASSKFKDCRLDGLDMFSTRPSPFWEFIYDISMQLYLKGNDEESALLDSLNNISITNLTKCNTTKDYRDTTPYRLTENCIEIFEEEMKALRPRHIIFFTGKSYDRYIDKLTFGYVTPPTDVTDRTYEKEIKNGRALWWHREFYENEEARMHFLRTRHPQGAPQELAREIAEWIRKEK